MHGRGRESLLLLLFLLLVFSATAVPALIRLQAVFHAIERSLS